MLRTNVIDMAGKAKSAYWLRKAIGVWKARMAYKSCARICNETKTWWFNLSK